MESRTKVIFTFLTLIFLIGGLYFFADWFSKATGYNVENDPDVSLTKCLTKKGIKFYGTDNCPLCHKQEGLFGTAAIQFLNYIDCSKHPGDCAHLQKVPAWYINGTLSYGIKTMADLRKLSACE